MLRLSYKVFASLLLLMCRMSSGSCQCRSDMKCTDSEYPSTELYSLRITELQPTSLAVKVYMTRCPEFETPGPSWYKLEALFANAADGQFEVPHPHTEASRVENNVIEFQTWTPTAYSDLPRTYTWTSAIGVNNIGRICFKLTLFDPAAEDNSNCTQVKHCIGGLEGSGSGEEFLQPSREARSTAEECPIPEQCQRNCEGRPEGPFCMNPYDGRTFKTRCDFQIYKCILRLQRENVARLEVILCSKLRPTPDLSSTTLTPPPTCSTTPTTPTPSGPCIEQNLYSTLRWKPKCTCSAEDNYKVLQCNLGRNECWCSSTVTGSQVGAKFDWEQCTDPENFDLFSKCFS